MSAAAHASGSRQGLAGGTARPVPPSRAGLGSDSRWTYRSRTVAALEHRFAVRTDDHLLGRALDRMLGTLPSAAQADTIYSLAGTAGHPGWFALDVDDHRVRETEAPWLALADLMWHINRRAVEQSSRYVLVHAAAAERDGVGVLLPAAMESGKTTLVAGLVRRGYRYLTDEAAALDPDTLLIHPYAKPLSIDRGSWAVLPDLAPQFEGDVSAFFVHQWQVSVSAIRPDAVGPPTVPRLIVSPRYEAGATTTVSELSKAAMLKVLAENTFHFRAAPRRNLGALSSVLAVGRTYELIVGDLDDAGAAVEELVRSVRT